MTANQCTLSGNSATLNNGGGLADPSGTVTLNQCTVVGNTTVLQGGGIAFQGTVAVNQCTITANTAQGTGGGGIWRNNTGALTLFNSIVAGNTQSSGNDVNSSVTTYSGVNLTNGAPLLAPLGNYGGPTPTMPPFPGSPAVDAGGATSFTTDQRGAGFPRVINGAPDIGAVEGVFNPPIALTGPTRLGNGTFQFGFTNYAGVSFTVLSSTNVTLPLNNWTVLGVPLEISPGQYQITDPQATNSPQKFYRVGAGHLSNLRWASRVLGFSSQYTTGGWSAAQALGQPDTYPLYGDFQWAWATAVTDDPNEYLELGFDPPAPVSSVSIYETFNPGAVSKVSVRNPNTGLWVQVWSGVAAPAPAVARIFTVTFPQTSFPVDAVRLDLDSQLVPDWNEIDAVRINW